MAPPDSQPPASSPAPAAPAPVAWDIDRVFPLIADPVRRRLLTVLALHGPKGVVELASAVGRRSSLTGKHLFALREGGLVVASRQHSRDKRKQLYELAPALQPQTQDGRLTIDFGFCLLRL